MYVWDMSAYILLRKNLLFNMFMFLVLLCIYRKGTG